MLIVHVHVHVKPECIDISKDGALALGLQHVHVHVKPECIDAFKAATVANALESRREPGIAGFDCLQQLDDSSRFVLIEAYRDANAPAQHKETRHYQVWRDAVAPMMAEPRTSVKFAPVPPEEQGRA